MKKILFLILFLCVHNCYAQNIVYLEYFIDVDPGQGKSIPVNFVPKSDIDLKITLDLNKITSGIHTLFLRAKDENGIWSMLFSQAFFKETILPEANITNMEYFFDFDPGLGKGGKIQIVTDKVVDTTSNFNITNLNDGIHSIFIRAKDNFGNWSIPFVSPFLKEPAFSNEITKITSINYYYSYSNSKTPLYSFKNFSYSSDVDVNFIADLSNINAADTLSIHVFGSDEHLARGQEFIYKFYSLLSPIAVIFPNGGEVWNIGASQTIKWRSSNISLINIELSTDNGMSWKLLASNVNASAGSFSIIAPDKISSSCLIRISDSTNQSKNDISNQTFNITKILEPPLNVKASDVPNDQGHHIKLTWTPSNSENSGSVSWYRIFRSRLNSLTTPILLTRFASIDSLNSWDINYTVLIDSVSAGKTEYIDSVPLNGVPYYYWMQAVGPSGSSQKVAAEIITLIEETKPLTFDVKPPYPNPFNPSTTIQYEIPVSCRVDLIIYDVLGRKVAVLKNIMDAPGVHNAIWNGKNERGMTVGSGVYFYLFKAGEYINQGKILFLR